MASSIDRDNYYDQLCFQYSGPERPRKSYWQYVGANEKQDEGL